MRQYKVAHFKRENEWAIFREDEDTIQWYGGNVWVNDKWDSRRYLHEEDCIWDLVLIKIRWDTIEDTLQAEKREKGERLEKKSWSEL